MKKRIVSLLLVLVMLLTAFASCKPKPTPTPDGGDTPGDPQSVVGKAYYGSGHNAQIADFIAAIQNKRAPEVTLADAANTAALVHAVYASAASGTWQKVADYLGK